MDPASDPTPDPTPFFSDLKDANFKLKFYVFCKHYFNPLNTFMRKGKYAEPDPITLLSSTPGYRCGRPGRRASPTSGGPSTTLWCARPRSTTMRASTSPRTGACSWPWCPATCPWPPWSASTAWRRTHGARSSPHTGQASVVDEI